MFGQGIAKEKWESKYIHTCFVNGSEKWSSVNRIMVKEATLRCVDLMSERMLMSITNYT